MGASAASGDGLALYGHALTRPQISRRPDFYAFAQSSSPDAPPHMRKRQRTMDATSVDAHPAMAQRGPPPPPMSVNEDAFITDEHAADDGDDDDDDGPKDKKAGRRKIKIEFIQDKSRRHITFSKRKAGKSRLHIHPL